MSHIDSIVAEKLKAFYYTALDEVAANLYESVCNTLDLEKKEWVCLTKEKRATFYVIVEGMSKTCPLNALVAVGFK